MNRNPVVFVALIAVLAFAAGCDNCSTGTDQVVFQHEMSGELNPWTHGNFDAADNKFMFALFSDVTGGERERVFEIAVAQLSLLRPELIMNVGDLIEGGTSDRDQLAREWESFDSRADEAIAPLFYVGGNHDLTNAVMRQVWDERYGWSYYHFVYKNMLFLVLDTEDNSPERMQEIFEARAEALLIIETDGMEAFEETEYANMPEQEAGNIGAEQSEYFRRVIAENPDVRWTFLFMHKAAWDKDGEENFAAIEQSLSERPYTLFNGHVHAYEHLERHGRDYIRLATTGGVQFPERGQSMDHVTLVTVSDQGVDIANLLMSGILDKTGHIPLDGDDVCFEAAKCGPDQ